MSRHCCNNNCCNHCNGYGNSMPSKSDSWVFILAILLIFGGGSFGESSFWNSYGDIFRCSGFNNGWCNNMGSSNSNLNTGNYTNSLFNSNNLSNANLSNTNLASNLGNLTESLN